MKRFIAGLALCLTLGAAAAPGWLTFAPHGAAMPQDQPFFLQEVPDALPDVTMGAADLVRILSSYNIIQQSSPTFCQQLYGLTNFSKSTIEICSMADPAQKQLVLLHEVFHIRYHEIGIETGGPYEPSIQEHAEASYKEIFRPKPEYVASNLK